MLRNYNLKGIFIRNKIILILIVKNYYVTQIIGVMGLHIFLIYLFRTISEYIRDLTKQVE